MTESRFQNLPLCLLPVMWFNITAGSGIDVVCILYEYSCHKNSEIGGMQVLASLLRKCFPIHVYQYILIVMKLLEKLSIYR